MAICHKIVGLGYFCPTLSPLVGIFVYWQALPQSYELSRIPYLLSLWLVSRMPKAKKPERLSRTSVYDLLPGISHKVGRKGYSRSSRLHVETTLFYVAFVNRIKLLPCQNPTLFNPSQL